MIVRLLLQDADLFIISLLHDKSKFGQALKIYVYVFQQLSHSWSVK